MGQVVRNEGLKPDLSKIEAMFKMELPKQGRCRETERYSIYLSLPKLSVTD